MGVKTGLLSKILSEGLREREVKSKIKLEDNIKMSLKN
jgi:hypothetical protein